ncbi:Alpha/Beta hydrolase protein [Roridomyces roridus]|uniref:Carboxylic ester hydrolase n=1 Tax=Roridomyces roridus TaxID=1738132 RepID=A0AAD7BL38_9AGAR|nr:Alpha/Beta hydrolase protein [Roridomyces roridus]
MLFALLLTASLTSAATTTGPVVDLGAAGKYLGVVQNNGTVHSWKAIPYAAPPVGDLRFKAPRPLPAQNSTLKDVSQDFPGQQTACVQFGTTDFVGVNAGPGLEDCLKLWIWAPAGAKEGDNLAVQVYTHGGGYQNSQSPNNDFSDWVRQDKNFIAVNANYRLGLLGFWNSVGSPDEGEDGNAGLLDGRFAVEWVVKHISKFGGDPKNIAVSGQSGGGGAIMNQLVLYDGTGYSFQKAIPRSIQRSGAVKIADLTARNDAFAKFVNCTDSAATKTGAAKQLQCMRAVSAEAIRLAALDFAATATEMGWLPSVDGRSLTDQPVRLFRNGKIAKVPVLTGHVTNELARLAAPQSNFTQLVDSAVGTLITPALRAQFEQIYPAAIPGNIFPMIQTPRKAHFLHRQWSFSDYNQMKCSSSMIVHAYSEANLVNFQFMFDAPQPGFPVYEAATHSSDNYFLQNATATMNATEVLVAHEWRAYVSSFIRHNDPNVEKLSTAPLWRQSSNDYRYEPQLVIAERIGASANLSAPTNSGMQLKDIAEWDRCVFHLSEDVIQHTLQ